MPPSATAATHLSPAELSYLHTSLSSHPPIRPDSRTPTDFRPLNAETGILPNTMGSAHVGFADGREAVVGVRAEVEKTVRSTTGAGGRDETGDDVEMIDAEGQTKGKKSRGNADWVTLGLTLPGMRDDDKDLVFLEEMLRETLVTVAGSPGFLPELGSESSGLDKSSSQSLQDALVINYRWHWRLYVDVLLISAPDQASSSSSGSTSGSGNYPLPLLSMAIHLALRDTRLPRLKSDGDEDPAADDDWDASVHLYSRVGNAKTGSSTRPALLPAGLVPPVTLLVMVVAENVIFDPSSTELAVADGVLAVSAGLAPSSDQNNTIGSVKILAVRALPTPARDTMKGIPRDAGEGAAGTKAGTDADQFVPGVWKPKIGGIKRAVLMKVVKSTIGGGVGREVLDGLNVFASGA